MCNKHLSRQRLTNRADHRTLTCAAQRRTARTLNNIPTCLPHSVAPWLYKSPITTVCLLTVASDVRERKRCNSKRAFRTEKNSQKSHTGRSRSPSTCGRILSAPHLPCVKAAVGLPMCASHTACRTEALQPICQSQLRSK